VVVGLVAALICIPLTGFLVANYFRDRDALPNLGTRARDGIYLVYVNSARAIDENNFSAIADQYRVIIDGSLMTIGGSTWLEFERATNHYVVNHNGNNLQFTFSNGRLRFTGEIAGEADSQLDLWIDRGATFNRLTAPTGLEINEVTGDYIMSWTNNPNSSGVAVYLRAPGSNNFVFDRIIHAPLNSIDIADLLPTTPAAGEWRIAVRALSSGEVHDFTSRTVILGSLRTNHVTHTITAS